MMHAFRSVCMVWCVLWIAATAHPQDAELAKDVVACEIVQYLATLAEQSAALRTECIVTGPLVVKTPNIHKAWPTEPPENMHELTGAQARIINWLHVDGRTRIERRRDDEELQLAWLWNGSTWCTQVRNGTEPHVDQLRIRSRPGSAADQISDFGIWNGGVADIPGPSAQSLAEQLRAADVVDASRTNDAIVARFRLRGQPIRREIQVMCRVLADEYLELAEVMTETFSRRQGTLGSRSVLTIDTWDDFDGIRLPAQAHRWNTYFDSPLLKQHGLGPQANYAQYQRISASVVDRATLDHNAFKPDTPPSGTWVDDTVQKIRYTIGESVIMIGRRRVQLAGPIDTVITEALLAKLLKSARG